MPVLAGDIGGTRARFALLEEAAGRMRPIRRWELPVREHVSIDSLLETVLADVPAAEVGAACFGVAGPVWENRVELTNLGWAVDGTVTARRFGIPHLLLVNDLVATGSGLGELAAEEIVSLKAGAPSDGSRGVLLAAGTGLGIALLRREADGWAVVPSEGGHVDLAPRNATEWELLRFLRGRLGGRVSVERAVSGLGIRNLFDFFRHRGLEADPDVVGRLGGDHDGRVVSEGAREGCPCCRAALELFVSMYGAVAGNVALLAAGWGGVLLAGGVTLGVRAELEGGEFLASFLDKGRLRPMLERVPVDIVLRDDVAILGAGRLAVREA